MFGEPAGEAVRTALGGAELILASDLTLIECDRVLIRVRATSRRIAEAEAADRRAMLSAAAAHWNLLRVDAEVVERARRPFPREPIRTLEAPHLATALVARSAIGDLALLSLDKRIRTVGRQLGLSTVPG